MPQFKFITVVEHTIRCRRFFVKKIESNSIENVDMSNDKQCEKHCRFKFKVFKIKIIFLSIL